MLWAQIYINPLSWPPSLVGPTSKNSVPVSWMKNPTPHCVYLFPKMALITLCTGGTLSFLLPFFFHCNLTVPGIKWHLVSWFVHLFALPLLLGCKFLERSFILFSSLAPSQCLWMTRHDVDVQYMNIRYSGDPSVVDVIIIYFFPYACVLAFSHFSRNIYYFLTKNNA